MQLQKNYEFLKFEQEIHNVHKFICILCILGMLMFLIASLYNTARKISNSTHEKKQNVFIFWREAMLCWLVLFFNNYYLIHTYNSLKILFLSTGVFGMLTIAILIMQLLVYIKEYILRSDKQ